MLTKLVQSGGLTAIARQLEESPSATLASARALLPGLLAGLRDYPGGLAALPKLFADMGGVTLAAAVMGPDPVDNAPGEEIIARIGGIMLTLQDDAQGDPSLRSRIAPLLAMLVVGYLSSRAAETAMNTDELAALLIAEDHSLGSSTGDSV